jgi:hypothetical protein
VTWTRRELSPLMGKLHRWGIARMLNSVSQSGRGWTTAYVETALPWRFLARYAARSWDTRCVRVERVGLLRRRWLVRYEQGRPLP